MPAMRMFFFTLPLFICACTGPTIIEPDRYPEKLGDLDFPFETIWGALTRSVHDLGFVARDAQPGARPAYLTTEVKKFSTGQGVHNQRGERVRVRLLTRGNRFDMEISASNYRLTDGARAWEWVSESTRLMATFVARFQANVTRPYSPKETSDAGR